MKSTGFRHTALAAALALAASSCYGPSHGHIHWNDLQQLRRSTHLNLTGHDPSGSETHGEHLMGNLRNVTLTVRRHFGNSNPENPYQSWTTRELCDPPGEPPHPSEFEVTRD